MHVVIINGSPRTSQYSNTDKIVGAFERGLANKGVTSERYAISDRNSWKDICHAYENNTQLSFILQGGFAEGCQYRCGEQFLEKLPSYLGCSYGGYGIQNHCPQDIQEGGPRLGM